MSKYDDWMQRIKEGEEEERKGKFSPLFLALTILLFPLIIALLILSAIFSVGKNKGKQ